MECPAFVDILFAQPAGETRTPTPAWSGLGFSCSMPEAVIRFPFSVSNLSKTCAFYATLWQPFGHFCFRELEHSKARAAREKEVELEYCWCKILSTERLQVRPTRIISLLSRRAWFDLSLTDENDG